MKVFKDFFNKKKRDLTVEAFDNIMDDKKEKLVEAVKERRLEVAVGVGVATGLVILGCLKMSHSSRQPQTVIYIIR